MAKLLPALEVTVLALSPPQKVHPPENLQLQQHCDLHWTCLSHPSFFSSQACLAWALHKASKCCMPWWRISRVAHNLPSGCLHPHFSLLFTCLDYHSCTCLPALAISQATARALIAPHSSSLKSAREPVTSSTMPFLAPPGNATHYAPVGTILNPFLTDQKCIILTPEQDLSNNHCILGSSSHCILLSPSGSSCKISRPPSQRHWRPAHPLYIPLGN